MRYLPAASLALTLLLAACGGRAPGSGEPDKPTVTVSIEPQRWLMERLVGDRMQVNALLAQGGNPESYEPAFSHLSALERSLGYFCVGGLGFEEAILEKVRANNPDLPIYVTSDSLSLIVSESGAHGHGVDPHVWSSAKNARVMAETMLHGLSELDPQNTEYYTANFIALAEHIDSVDNAIEEMLTPGEAFMVWHPSLSYFARDYELTQIALGADHKEFSVADTRALIDRSQSLGAEVFLVQREFDSSQAEVLTEGRGDDVRVVTINPLSYDWDEELLHTARAIAGED